MKSADQLQSRFVHDVLLPFQELNQRLSRANAVDVNEGVGISGVRQVATALFHFPESAQEYMGSSASSLANLKETSDWRLVGDIANTWKHGGRSSKTREVKLYQALAYEWKAGPVFRFLRVYVWASYSTLAENHDSMKILGKLIASVAQIVSLPQPPEVVPMESAGPFLDSCDVKSEGGSFIVSSSRLNFFELKNGEYILSDPPGFSFAVY